MDKLIYEAIKNRAISISRDNGACKSGYHDLMKAEDIGHFCMVLKKYWDDVIGMHRKEALLALDELYPSNREEFNRYGIFYNDSSNTGMCIVTLGENLIFGGNAKVWLFGLSEAKITGRARCVARDNSKVIAMNGAHIQLFDDSTATILGYCYVRGDKNNKVQCHFPAKVFGCEKIKQK